MLWKTPVLLNGYGCIANTEIRCNGMKIKTG